MVSLVLVLIIDIVIIGASEASPLVSHARGPGGVCMYVVDRQGRHGPAYDICFCDS